jgi:nitrogen fixation protein NifU and related proteins
MNIALYNTLLMDHYKNPRHAGPLNNPTISSSKHNPSCGDMIQFQSIIQNNRITNVGFVGAGCVISQGTASLLAEYSIGKTVDQIIALGQSDIVAMIGLSLGPIRLKCALLPLQALQEGLCAFAKK